MPASPDGVAPFHNRNDLLRTTVDHLSGLTVMKKAGRKLNLHDQHLQLVIDTVPALLAYVGKDERYRLVNAAYETWFERPREDIVGRTVSEVHGNAYARACSNISPEPSMANRSVTSIPFMATRAIAMP